MSIKTELFKKVSNFCEGSVYNFNVVKPELEHTKGKSLLNWVEKSKFSSHPMISEMGKLDMEGETVVIYHDWSFDFFINGEGEIAVHVKLFNPDFHKFIKMVFTNDRVMKHLARYLIVRKQPSKFFEIIRNYESGDEKRLMKKIMKIFIKFDNLTEDELKDLETKKLINIMASDEADSAMALHFDEQCRLIEALESPEGTTLAKVVDNDK
jgi:hypothetical protein